MLERLAEREGVIETLNAENHMLWIGRMKNIRYEIVKANLYPHKTDNRRCAKYRLSFYNLRHIKGPVP